MTGGRAGTLRAGAHDEEGHPDVVPHRHERDEEGEAARRRSGVAAGARRRGAVLIGRCVWGRCLGRGAARRWLLSHRHGLNRRHGPKRVESVCVAVSLSLPLSLSLSLSLSLPLCLTLSLCLLLRLSVSVSLSVCLCLTSSLCPYGRPPRCARETFTCGETAIPPIDDKLQRPAAPVTSSQPENF